MHADPSRRHYGPWLAAGIVATILLLWRFGFGTLKQAEFIVWNFGYDIYRLTTVIWLLSAGAVLIGLKDTLSSMLKPALGAAALCALLIGLYAHHEPAGYKVNYDEPLHANVAKTMHELGVSAPAQTVVPSSSALETTQYSSSHRAALYSYLVSVVHDTLGYDDRHPFLVNALMMGAVWMCVWFMVQLRGDGPAPGLFAVLTLGAIPLMIHSAFSAQADVANLLFLAIFLLSIQLCHREWNRTHIRFLIATGAMLALARSESIAYLAVIALLFTIEWRRGRRSSPGWSALLITPALILAMAVQLILMSNPANITQGVLAPGEPIHQAVFFRAHAQDVFTYFCIGTAISGTPGLAWLMAGAAMITLMRRIRHRTWPLATLGWLACVAIYGAFYLVLLSSFWSGPSDILMERFTLPIWLFGTLGLTLTIHLPKPRPWVAALWCAIPLATIMTHTLPRISSKSQWETNGLAQAQSAWIALAQKHATPHSYILAPSHYALVNAGIASAPAKRLTTAPDFFQNLISAGKINELLLIGIAQQGIVTFSADANDIATAATFVEMDKTLVGPDIEIRLYRVLGYRHATGLYEFTSARGPLAACNSANGTFTRCRDQP